MCGSDGMNINGLNRLACITPVDQHWLKHLNVYSKGQVNYRPVNMKPHSVDPLKPMERVY